MPNLRPNKKREKRRPTGWVVFCCCGGLSFVLIMIAAVVVPVCLNATQRHALVQPMFDAIQTQTLFLGENDMLNAGDVIHIETLIINSGFVLLQNLTLTDSVPINTRCEPEFVNNTITFVAAGDNVTCVGTHIVTQDDIDTAMFSVETNITNLMLPIVTVTSKSNLTDPAIDAFNATQTQTLCLGADDMLNAGDVIQIQTVILNTGTTTLENLTLTDFVPLGTVCQTAGMDNVIPTLESGDNITCFGMHTITQMDIDAQIFIATTNISSPTLSDQQVQSSTNLTQTTFGAIYVNQMASVDIGSDDFLNAGDVVEVTVHVMNIGTETLLNVTTDTFNGTLVGEFLPMQSVNYSYFIVLEQTDLDIGTLLLNETAVGTGTTSNMPVQDDSFIEVNVTQTEEGRIRLQTSFANTTQCAQIGDVVVISVAVENFGTASLFNVNVENSLVGAGLVCGPMGMDNIIGELLPGQTILCNGGYMLMGSDITFGIDSLLVSNSSANGQVLEPDLEFVYKAVFYLYFKYAFVLIGASSGLSTADFSSPGSLTSINSQNPSGCTNGLDSRGYRNMNGRSLVWQNFDISSRHLYAEMIVSDVDSGGVQIITDPPNLFSDWQVTVLAGTGSWNPTTGVLSRSGMNVSYKLVIGNLLDLISITIRYFSGRNDDFQGVALAEIVNTTLF